LRAKRLVLLIFAALLCAGGLFFVLHMQDDESAANAPAALSERIHINEVMSSNKGAVPDANGNYPDWVELYNPTDTAVDISGYGLSDDKLSAAKWAFPSGTTIPANGYIVVFCSGDASEGPLHAAFRLSATDALTFSSPTGNVLDSLSLKAVPSGYTLGLDASNNWVEMAEPSPGHPNTTEGAAAYRASLNEGVEDIGVYINEFMASNATTIATADDDYADWVELYNSTSSDIDISGFGLSDNLSQPVKWRFPAGTILPANGYLLVFCSGQEGLIGEELHAPFGLRTYAEDVVLSNASGRVLDSLSYTTQETDRSMARLPDGSGEFQMTAQPTPGYPNTEEGFVAFQKTSALPRGPLMISEVMIANASYLVQDDGSTPDWIELYNSGDSGIDLTGYGLSDNPNNPAKWTFPEGASIAAGEHMVILATGNNVRDLQKKNLETSFSLNADGEVLLLFDPDGALLDKLQIGAGRSGISYGRTEAQFLYYTTPPPGETNAGGMLGIASQPVFVTKPGVYEQGISVELLANAGETIHYTTDCTTPDASSPVYAGPIQVSENTVIRAVSLKEDHIDSYSVSGTYLFTTDGADHALPIATLVTDPDNLWDSKTGIYTGGENFINDPDAPLADALLSANYYQGRAGAADQADWEREANFAVFDEENRQQAFSQNVAIRIAGGYGRVNAQKGFNIVARSDYGSNRMEYPFFENREFTAYKSVVLRSGAQDQPRSKIRDELATGLLEGTDVNFLYQAYKPYVLYLNGEYWGVYFLKEKRSRFFVAQHEGWVDNDNIDLVKSETRASHGTVDDWKEFMSYIRSHDLSDPSNYEYVCSQMDVNSFMDYMICEIYVGNSDYWNIQYYKPEGGKWKWIFYDFCYGFYNVNHETVSLRRKSTQPCSDLFNALLKNSEWRDVFLRRFAEIMDTVYDVDRVNALVDELYAAVEPEIKRERELFNGDSFRGVILRDISQGSYEGFQRHVSIVREFAEKRPSIIKAQLQKEFNLSDAYMQEVFGA